MALMSLGIKNGDFHVIWIIQDENPITLMNVLDDIYEEPNCIPEVLIVKTGNTHYEIVHTLEWIRRNGGRAWYIDYKYDLSMIHHCNGGI